MAADEDGIDWAISCADQIVARKYSNMGVTYSPETEPDGEYSRSIDVLPPQTFKVTLGEPVNYSLTWLPQVLMLAGLKVQLVPGWETRGHGDAGPTKGVVCHHTNGARTGNMPSLPVLINGRPDLGGPLAQLGLGRDGTYYVVAAGLCWHAGPGGWQGLSGNTNVIGIEAENVGDGSDPWPAVQMDAYRRGVAAILRHIGAPAIMCCGHKEWTPRKDDPNFDMNQFRRDVAALLGEMPPDRVIGLGDSGEDVKELQRLLGMPQTGVFDAVLENVVRAYQTSRALDVDGIVGPKTWAALRSGAPARPMGGGQRFTGITATVFGGTSDPNTSAYDEHFISDVELGVSLPARFSGMRPKVRVFANGRSVVAGIVDVGPWNTRDAYWQSGARPMAEQQFRDRTTAQNGQVPTNNAGIDLTVALAQALGVNGKGAVDWEFVSDDPVVIIPPTPKDPMPDPNPTPFNPAVEDFIATIRPAANKLASGSARAPTPEEIRQYIVIAFGGAPALPGPVILPPGTPNTGGTPGSTPTAPVPAPSTGGNIAAGLLALLMSLGLSAGGVIPPVLGPDAATASQIVALAGPILAALNQLRQVFLPNLKITT